VLPPSRGIVRAPAPDGLLVGRRLAPGPASPLAPFVHHGWSIRWELHTPYTAEVLAHPAVQLLLVEADGARTASVVGVPTRKLARTLAGTGETFGLTFRPAMFRALTRGSLANLTDRVVPLAEVFGDAAEGWTERTRETPLLEDKIALAEAFLAPLLRLVRPSRTASSIGVRDLVERIVLDRAILRVDDLVAVSGLDLRTLQRTFRDQVGVSPKWVIRRYRLHEAALQLAEDEAPPLADLAAALGYADQAHFGRDFKAAVGVTPQRFRRGRFGIPPVGGPSGEGPSEI
jgi:AraC-like DNA-binding protein